MRIILFSIAVSLLTFWSCQQEAPTQVTPGGYEYVIHTNSEGLQPQPGDYVYFQAQIRNGDSVVYASREQGQTPFIQIPMGETPPGRTPSPVEDVLRLMNMGDSATVKIRIDTMPQKMPGFEDAEFMYYDVVLTEVKTQEEYQAERELVRSRESEVAAYVQEMARKYQAGELDDQLQTTDSGLKYIIEEEGEGPKPIPGSPVSVHYYGTLTDGTMFDNSFQRGEPISFPIAAGRVIRGWDEGISLLNKGSNAVLFIPSELAYGAAGSPPVIPPDSELIFYVELQQE